MACFQPLLAVDKGIKEDGKHDIQFVGLKHPEWDLAKFRSFYGDSLMMLPCGKCVACLQDYSRTWTVRLLAESLYYKEMCFVTLTYKENPPKQPLKRHLRAFIDRVRKQYGKGIKFFGCGETGEQNGRSHYHLILFGVDFSKDKGSQIVQRSINDFLYSSPMLSKLWRFGFSSVGSVSPSSIAYVTRYCDKKKLDGIMDGTFCIMSRGLGKRYCKDHYHEIYDSDFLYFYGQKYPIPRYFAKLALSEDDFYLKCKVWDLTDRKMARAQSFRYNSSKSLGLEENSMKDLENIALSRKEQKEFVRDVRDI